DLHVLSTPPAFVLSQDQTLREVIRSTPQAKRLLTESHLALPLPHSSARKLSRELASPCTLFSFQGPARRAPQPPGCVSHRQEQIIAGRPLPCNPFLGAARCETGARLAEARP